MSIISDFFELNDRIYKVCKNHTETNIFIKDIPNVNSNNDFDYYLSNKNIEASGYNIGDGTKQKAICKRIINNSDKKLTDISLYDEKYGIYLWSKKDYHYDSINIDKDSFINICIYSYISINDLILGYSDNLGQNYKCLLFKDLM